MAKKKDETYVVSIGKHVGIVDPADGFEPRVELTYEELRDLLMNHVQRATKDGAYCARPMGGDGKRSDRNALPWYLIPIDGDEILSTDLQVFLRWCKESKLKMLVTSTYSHTAAHPRVRIWLFASRETTATEHTFIHRALSRLIPFKIDDCMAKPSQPIFLPACPAETAGDAFSYEFDGERLDIDRLLASYRSEIEEEQRLRAERASSAGTGVRQPGGLVDYFNQNYDLRDLLEQHGYKRKSRNRFIAPGSKSKRAAVVLYEHALVSFHEPAHDPLAVRNKFQQAMVLDSFAAYCKLNHHDDFKAAFKSALTWARAQGWTDETQTTKSSTPAPAPLLLNPEDLYSVLKPQDMLVEGMLDRGAVVVASGDSNSGKTTILQYLAFQVAQGAPFNTHSTKQGRVLWIAGEDTENAKYRVVAMCEEYGVDAKTLGDNLLILPQPVAILQPESMEALRLAVEQRAGEGAEFALVVVDSKSVNWGGLDENSNDENASFVAAVRTYLIAPFGRPAAVVTHHLTKHREKEARSSRGAGALINNADHEWRFEMNQEARISMIAPGSKLRIERWVEQRFEIKVVNLPPAKFPQLKNSFGATPRVSIAEPVNQYNKSMRQLQVDVELRAVLTTLTRLQAKKKKPAALTHIAQDVNWVDSQNRPDYRKVKRVLEYGIKQKLVLLEDKQYQATEAGARFLEEDVSAALESEAPVEPEEREPGSDDE